jgi:hypothetical protein
MYRACASRAFAPLLLCAALSLGSLWAVRFVQARGKPVVDGSGVDDTANALAIAPQSGSLPAAPLPAAARERSVQLERMLPSPKPSQPGTGPLRVLMVGNSYTMHHSLHQMLERVANGVDGGPKLTADAVARGGYSLRNHLRTGPALQRIRAGHYTHVVLQGHSLSAVDHPNEFAEDAERFKQAIDSAEGHTVFYATWARSPEVSLYRTHKQVHSFEDMSTRVSSVYFQLSSRLNAALAPVGSAFERALVTHPKLPLWGSDGSHPSLAGSYMAACVLYGAITGRDPSTTSYVPNGLKDADAQLVREVAVESLGARSHALPLTGAASAASVHGPT